MSLSARRAWIEMAVLCLASVLLLVALRKESVDRNDTEVGIPNTNTRSLSARRAWIEMHTGPSWAAWFGKVALRKESVDRNSYVKWKIVATYGRSPQGERG